MCECNQASQFEYHYVYMYIVCVSDRLRLTQTLKYNVIILHIYVVWLFCYEIKRIVSVLVRDSFFYIKRKKKVEKRDKAQSSRFVRYLDCDFSSHKKIILKWLKMQLVALLNLSLIVFYSLNIKSIIVSFIFFLMKN